MSSTLLVVGKLQPKSAEARDELVSRISAIGEFAKTSEPETHKYCVTIPTDASDLSIYVIEQYASRAAFDKHMAAPVVQDVVSLLTTKKDELLAGPGGIAFSTPVAGFTRPSVAGMDDALIVWAALDYNADVFENSVEGWKAVVAGTEANEEDVVVYTSLKDEVANRVRMLEVYKNQETFNTHVAKEYVQKKLKEEERIRTTDPEVVFLKKAGGFLYK